MANRKHATYTGKKGVVTVYFDCSADEYTCKLAGHPNADYFTNDCPDAIATARLMAGLTAKDDQEMSIVTVNYKDARVAAREKLMTLADSIQCDLTGDVYTEFAERLDDVAPEFVAMVIESFYLLGTDSGRYVGNLLTHRHPE